MIRQFTIVPALLGIFAMIISACSAEVGETGGGSGGSGSGSSSSGSSVSSAQNSGSSSSSSQNSTGEFTSLSGKVDRVLRTDIWDAGELHWASFLLEDGSITERDIHLGFELSPVDIKNIKHVPYYPYNGDSNYNVCALTHDAEVYCWGTNKYGQVGNGTYDSSAREEFCGRAVEHNGVKWNACTNSYYFNAFRVLSDIKDLISIDFADTFCALTLDDNAYCWGKNNGFDASGATMVNKPFPVDASQYQFTGVPEDIVKIEYKSVTQSCEIHSSGKVTCQGYNSGDGLLFGKENKALPYSANPVEIDGIEQAQSFIDRDKYGFSQRWGYTYDVDGACILRKDDKIQCWGDDEGGIITYTP